MLDAKPDFYDLLEIADPGMQCSEALAIMISDLISDEDVHPIIAIAALANTIIAYLCEAPTTHRAKLTDSLLNDIRRMVRLDA